MIVVDTVYVKNVRIQCIMRLWSCFDLVLGLHGFRVSYGIRQRYQIDIDRAAFHFNAINPTPTPGPLIPIGISDRPLIGPADAIAPKMRIHYNGNNCDVTRDA